MSHLSLPTRTFTVNGVSFNMIRVDGGTFTMGATPEQGKDVESNEKPVHQVTLSTYYIGETEVMGQMWDAVMGTDFWWFFDGPIANVSWNDCQEFIRRLNVATGQNFHLPTEAQWEYSANGGSEGGRYTYSGSNTIEDVAWYGDNARYGVGENTPDFGTHIVATKIPNELGLYDMSGNVCEWCQDWYDDYPSSSQTNPTGPSSGSSRVYRGGSWSFYFKYCRVSHRESSYPDYRATYKGLRLAL